MRRLLPRVFITLTVFSLLAVLSAQGQSDPAATRVCAEWKEISQTVPAEKQAPALKSLADKADRLVARDPDEMELRLWEAIVMNSYAKAAGRHHVPETLPEIIDRIRLAQMLDKGDTRI